MDYLNEAAKILARRDAEIVRKGFTADLEIARHYALLGAIERGLLPNQLAEEIYDQYRKKGR